MLNNALKSSVRSRTSSSLFSTIPATNYYIQAQIGRKGGSGVRFLQQAVPGPSSHQPDKKTLKPTSKTTGSGDTMSSFGEGYATRSDEEGFGGIYGGIDDEDQITLGITENDTSQGSVVKEKETARNQKTVT